MVKLGDEEAFGCPLHRDDIGQRAGRNDQATGMDAQMVRLADDVVGTINAIIAEIDANDNRTEYGYDDAGRRTSVTDALGNVTTFSYDFDGNLLAEEGDTIEMGGGFVSVGESVGVGVGDGGSGLGVRGLVR